MPTPSQPRSNGWAATEGNARAASGSKARGAVFHRDLRACESSDLRACTEPLRLPYRPPDQAKRTAVIRR